MASDLERKILTALTTVPGVEETHVVIRLAPEESLVRVTGELAGRSVVYAWRRRQRITRELRKIETIHAVRVSLTVDVDDAVTRMERAVLAAIRVIDARATSAQLALGRGKRATIRMQTESPDDSVEKDKAKITSVVRRILREGHLFLSDIELVGTSSLRASDPLILRAIRVRSPAHVDRVRQYLEEHGIRIQSDTVLAHRLDALRQRGLIRHVGDGVFVLSGTAIASLPGIAGRRSADVERALDLARRRW